MKKRIFKVWVRHDWLIHNLRDYDQSNVYRTRRAAGRFQGCPEVVRATLTLSKPSPRKRKK